MDVHQLSSQILQTQIESQADEDWIAEDSGAVTVTSEANPSQLPPPLSLTQNATPSTPTQRTFMNPMRGWMATPSGAFNGFRGLASRAVRAFIPTFRQENRRCAANRAGGFSNHYGGGASSRAGRVPSSRGKQYFEPLSIWRSA